MNNLHDTFNVEFINQMRRAARFNLLLTYLYVALAIGAAAGFAFTVLWSLRYGGVI